MHDKKYLVFYCLLLLIGTFPPITPWQHSFLPLHSGSLAFCGRTGVGFVTRNQKFFPLLPSGAFYGGSPLCGVVGSILEIGQFQSPFILSAGSMSTPVVGPVVMLFWYQWSF